MTALERIWYDSSLPARIAKGLLFPFELGYGAVVAARNRLYDSGLLTVHQPPVPALSVGNLSVGGTGKTPIAAYLVTRLVARGARPGLLLRGYGDDETRVHSQLNPGLPVVVDPDRVRGVRLAKEAGCDVVVMDDAFQHRRAGRTVDMVLISAERFSRHPRLLPAGPWREGLSALHRASVVVVTRKVATTDHAQSIGRFVTERTGHVTATVALMTDRLERLAGDGGRALSSLAGASVLAVAGIANPAAFAGQLREAGIHVDLRAFRDHHAFSAHDIDDLAAAAARHDAVVCTLKDAVKLELRWPRSAPPLWYVSQRVVPEVGAEHVDAALTRVLDARH